MSKGLLNTSIPEPAFPEPTDRDFLMLHRMANSSSQDESAKARKVLADISQKSTRGNVRLAAKRMLFEAANPGQEYQTQASDTSSLSMPAALENKATARGETPGVGEGYDSEWSLNTSNSELPTGLRQMMADSARRASTGETDPTVDKTWFPRFMSPAWRKQVAYEVGTGPTLGHNVIPAAADWLLGTKDFSPEEMAQAAEEHPLSTADRIGTIAGGGAFAGKMLAPVLGPLRTLGQGKTAVGSALKTAGLEAAGLHGLNTASGAAEGLFAVPDEAPDELKANVVAEKTKEAFLNPVPAIFGALAGAAGGAGRNLSNSSPNANYLRSKGAKVGLFTAGKGGVLEGDVAKAGLDAKGNVVPASLRAGEIAAVDTAQRAVEPTGRIKPGNIAERERGAVDSAIRAVDPSGRISPEAISAYERQSIDEAVRAIEPSGRIKPEAIKMRERQAAMSIDAINRAEHDAAQKELNKAVSGLSGDEWVPVTEPRASMLTQTSNVDNTHSTRTSLRSELLDDFFDRPPSDEVANSVRIVPKDGPPLRYVDAVRSPVSQGSPLVDMYERSIAESPSAKPRGVLPTDRVEMKVEMANRARVKADNPANWTSSTGGNDLYRGVAEKFRHVLSATPRGRANMAYSDALERIENAKQATGYSGTTKLASVDPAGPGERRSIENTLASVAKDYLVNGEAGMTPEFKKAISDFPQLRDPMEALAKFIGKSQDQAAIEGKFGTAAREMPSVGWEKLDREVTAAIDRAGPDARSALERLSGMISKSNDQATIESKLGQGARELSTVGWEKLDPELVAAANRAGPRARGAIEELAKLIGKSNDQGVLESKLGQAAADLPVVGPGRLDPELMAAIQRSPGAMSALEQLAALNARQRLQSRWPNVRPRLAAGGGVGVSAYPNTELEGFKVRAAGPALEIPDLALPYAVPAQRALDAFTAKKEKETR